MPTHNTSATSPLRIGVFTTDNRDHWRKYDLPNPIFGPAIEALFEGFALFPQEIEVHIISATQKPLQHPDRLGPNLWYHSVVVPKWGWLRGAYAGCIRAVRSQARVLRLDLVHGQGTERDCALEAVFSGLPNILTLHGNMRAVARALQAKPFTYHWFHSYLEALAIRRAGMVFCNSSYTESQARPLNPHSCRMPNPVRSVFFEPAHVPPPKKDASLKLLVVGLIAGYKQPLEILRVLREWRQRGAPPFHCRWVGALSGETAYVRSFLSEMAAAQADGWADHCPAMPAQALRGEMDARDILIHVPKEEAFGLVVAEAMLRGMRIVGAQAGGMVDFAPLYPAFSWVDPQTPSDWVQVLDSPECRSPTRTNRDQWNSLLYHPREIARRHLECYRSFLHPSRAA
jgi:glycosyltransferase involved in cell wall biosynthesis